MSTFKIAAWVFNCSESPFSSFFLVGFFFLVCSPLSHVLLTVSFILLLTSPKIITSSEIMMG